MDKSFDCVVVGSCVVDVLARPVALVEPIGLASRKGSFQAAPCFVEHVRRLLEERYGRTVLYELGLRVHTTVDLVMQVAAETVLRKGIDDVTARLATPAESRVLLPRLRATWPGYEAYEQRAGRDLHLFVLEPVR